MFVLAKGERESNVTQHARWSNNKLFFYDSDSHKLDWFFFVWEKKREKKKYEQIEFCVCECGTNWVEEEEKWSRRPRVKGEAARSVCWWQTCWAIFFSSALDGIEFEHHFVCVLAPVQVHIHTKCCLAVAHFASHSFVCLSVGLFDESSSSSSSSTLSKQVAIVALLPAGCWYWMRRAHKQMADFLFSRCSWQTFQYFLRSFTCCSPVCVCASASPVVVVVGVINRLWLARHFNFFSLLSSHTQKPTCEREKISFGKFSSFFSLSLSLSQVVTLWAAAAAAAASIASLWRKRWLLLSF